jgi:DNA modification methylase
MQLYQGNCLEILPTLEANSVDTIITDPPYGLSFMGKEWDHGVPGEPFWREALRVAKPGAILMAFGGSRTYHRLTCAIEDAGWEIRDCMMWLYGSGFPKSHDIGKGIDRAAGKKREVVGPGVFAARRPASRRVSDGGSPVGEAALHYGDGHNITAPATPLAQQWHGWGTALKPAYEPIIVAQKPLDGTYAQNAEKWGVAGLWIDGGRISTSDDLSGGTYGGTFSGSRNEDGSLCKAIGSGDKGRWPANLILDDESAAAIGEPSRFFYTAKASRAEREFGLDELPMSIRKNPMRSANGTGEKNFVGGFPDVKARNTHPTVKPLAVMRYLCRLTKTPTGGVVLDPFAGSGTTLMAALLEGRDAIGIELEQEYFEIMRRRVEAVQAQIAAVADMPVQLALAGD